MTGYSQVADVVAADAALSANAVRLYLLLLSRDKRRTGVVWPSYEWLSERTRSPERPEGLSESTLRRELGRLAAAGYVTVAKRGGNRSNLYTLLVVVRGGKLMDPSPMTGRDLSPVTGETEEPKQRKQRNKGPGVGGDSNGRGSGIEGVTANVVALPAREAVA